MPQESPFDSIGHWPYSQTIIRINPAAMDRQEVYNYHQLLRELDDAKLYADLCAVKEYLQMFEHGPLPHTQHVYYALLWLEAEIVRETDRRQVLRLEHTYGPGGPVGEP